MEAAHFGDRCHWCKHPKEKIRARALCGHCYRIHSKLEALKDDAAALKAQGKAIHPELDLDLRTYKQMAQSAKVEGRKYGEIHLREVKGLNLEHEFSHFSKRFAKKDLFHGLADVFDWSFSEDQKRLLYYLLSLILREDNRRRRKYRASNQAILSERGNPAAS